MNYIDYIIIAFYILGILGVGLLINKNKS